MTVSFIYSVKHAENKYHTYVIALNKAKSEETWHLFKQNMDIFSSFKWVLPENAHSYTSFMQEYIYK